MAILSRSAVILAVLLASAPLSALRVTAQTANVPELTAAFLTNFVKFAAWPDDVQPASGVFTYCVAGDKAVAAALESSIKSHPAPEPQNVLFVAPDGPLGTCQMLYLADVNLRQAQETIALVQGAPVFTVSNVNGFAEIGGVAQLKLEKGRMHFAINPAAARRARLSLSAKLLGLATIVKDRSEANR
jgi:hypothetical protein